MARRLMLLTLSLALLTGCGAQPMGTDVVRRSAVASAPAVKMLPTVSIISSNGAALNASVSVRPGLAAAPAVLQLSQAAAGALTASDAGLEAIDLLAEDSAAYGVQSLWSDIKDKYNQIKDSLKRAWTNFKLKREAKAMLKHKIDDAKALRAADLDEIRAHRTTPITQINPIDDGGHEIVTAWSSDYKGLRHVETRRRIDTEGVTQMLIVSVKGKTEKGLAFEALRTRSLINEDGAYRVETKELRTLEDGRTLSTEWVKQVLADGSETLAGHIIHPDGYRTEISGTRDAKGKVKISVEKIAPAPKSES